MSAMDPTMRIGPQVEECLRVHTDLPPKRRLVDRVQSGEIQYCPHGRPVAVRLSKYQVEKMFKRA